tara:strand:- start:1323 stop:4040 length:2718 start_codon:yes stop_codon:yes gene_type:complete
MRNKLLKLIIVLLTVFFNSVSAIYAQTPFDVVPLAQVTHTVVQSGQWSDPNSWNLGVPTAGAKVLIPYGYELTVDGIISVRIKTIRLEGKLTFLSNLDTELKVETIVGGVSSELQIGTPLDPILSNVTAKILFIDEGPIDLLNDFEQFGKGLVSMGKTEMYGQNKLFWTSLAIAPTAGSNTITLSASPIGWEIGDEIVIAATQLGNPESDEKRTITSITGNVVEMNQALNIDHLPPNGYNLKVHIANLTRNIILESESAVINKRAHIMFMHTLDVNIQNVRMHQLGRTNKRVQLDDWSFPTLEADNYVAGQRTNIRGRYSCHFHRGGVDPNNTVPAVVSGCVVEDDPGWAYVNHSSNVDFIDNVSYNIVGGAFQTESGDEIGSFIDNIALRTINPDYPLLDSVTFPVDIRESSQDFAFQGEGFWFHGGGVSISGNVSAGNSGHGFIFWTEGQREVGTAFNLQNMFKVSNIPNSQLLPSLADIQSWWVPCQQFQNNTAYSAVNGFAAYYIHATLFEDVTELTTSYLATVHTSFDDLTLWNVSKFGVELQNCERFTFNNLRIINDSFLSETEGIHCWQTVGNKNNWFNLEVNGFELGMTPPMQGTIHICGGSFTNETDLRLISPQRDSRALGQLRDLKIENIVFGQSNGVYNFSNEIPIKMEGEKVLNGNISLLDPEFASKYFLIPDRINVNLIGMGQKTLYYNQQAASFTPITPLNIGLASGLYASLITNKTNQEIFDQTGLAFAGGIHPQNSVTHSYVEGGLVSSTDIQRKIPPCHFIQEGYYPANYFDNFDFFTCCDTTTIVNQVDMIPHIFTVCNQTISIPENNLIDFDLVVFPNPFSNQINVKFNDVISSISIYGIEGKLLYELFLNSKETAIDLSKFNRGSFILKVKTKEGKTATRKLLKL